MEKPPPQQPGDDEKIPIAGQRSAEIILTPAAADEALFEDIAREKMTNPDRRHEVFGVTPAEQRLLAESQAKALAMAEAEKQAKEQVEIEKKVIDPEKIRATISGASDMTELMGRLVGLGKEVGEDSIIKTSAGDMTLGEVADRLQDLWSDESFRKLVKVLSPEGLSNNLANNGITSTGGLREVVTRIIINTLSAPKEENPPILKRLAGKLFGK